MSFFGRWFRRSSSSSGSSSAAGPKPARTPKRRSSSARKSSARRILRKRPSVVMAGKRPSMESAETRANILLRAGNIRAYDVRAKRKVHMKSDPAPQIVSRLNKRNGKRILFIKGIAKETGNEVWRLVGQM